MNIFGIETDIVNVERIKKSMKNKIFIERIFIRIIIPSSLCDWFFEFFAFLVQKG